MKKIYITLAFVAISLGTFAQGSSKKESSLNKTISAPSIQKNSDQLIGDDNTILVGSGKTEGGADTAGHSFTGHYLPIFNSQGGDPADLFVQEYDSGGFVLGTFRGTPGEKVPPYTAVIQGYKNTTGVPALITEALIQFGPVGHGASHSSADSIMVYLSTYSTSQSVQSFHCETSSYGPGGPQWWGGGNFAKAAVLKVDNINGSDNFDDYAYTSIPFPSAYSTNKDFFVGLDFSSLIKTNVVGSDTVGLEFIDSVGIFSDNEGDALGLDYLYFYGEPDPNHYRLIPANCWFTDGFDVTAAIFVVLSDHTGVEDFFNGMKLVSNYPNPAVASTTIQHIK
jgi:hypothetical protein